MIFSLPFKNLPWLAILCLVACHQTETNTVVKLDSAHVQPSTSATSIDLKVPSVESNNTPPKAKEAGINNTNAQRPSTPSTVETYGRYTLKSGYVEMESTVDIDKDYHSQSITKKSFDNYGRDELMELTTETTTNGNKKIDNQRFLMRSGWMHNLRPDYIAARQHPYSQFNLENMEFSLLDADAMHLYNIKSLGYQVKDGHNCMHYYIDYHSKDSNMKGDMWTYKNLFYGMDVLMNDAHIRSKVTHLEEDININQSKFDIPEGYRVIDADNLDN